MNSIFNYQSQVFGELFKSIQTFKNIKNRNIMQTIKNLFTALLIGFVTIANANNNPIATPTANLTETANEKIRLNLNSIEKTNLKIQDANGFTIYDEVIKSKNAAVAKEYDLTTLANGTYVFSIELSDKIIEQTVILKDGNTTLGTSIILAKPVFFEGNNSLFITIDGIENSMVEVKILDNDGFEIYQNKQTNINQFNTKYNMDKLMPASYTAVVRIDGKIYYKNIQIN